MISKGDPSFQSFWNLYFFGGQNDGVFAARSWSEWTEAISTRNFDDWTFYEFHDEKDGGFVALPRSF